MCGKMSERPINPYWFWVGFGGKVLSNQPKEGLFAVEKTGNYANERLVCHIGRFQVVTLCLQPILCVCNLGNLNSL